jgi:hypothetical protein
VASVLKAPGATEQAGRAFEVKDSFQVESGSAGFFTHTEYSKGKWKDEL